MTTLNASAAAMAGEQGQVVNSVLKHPFLAALGKPQTRKGLSPVYLVVLAMVAVMMLLLPVIYVALIGLVGYGVYLHAVHDAWIMTTVKGRAVALVFLLYLLPIAAGLTLILFMIKPLFAPRRYIFAP